MSLKCKQCNLKPRANHRTICYSCHNKNTITYRKEWYLKNGRQSNRKSHLKRKFGLSLEQYQDMLDKQNGCCAICRRHHSTFTRPLHVDHCHRTGRIRGLLCMCCNNYIGYIKEDLTELITYLNVNRMSWSYANELDNRKSLVGSKE